MWVRWKRGGSSNSLALVCGWSTNKMGSPAHCGSISSPCWRCRQLSSAWDLGKGDINIYMHIVYNNTACLLSNVYMFVQSSSKTEILKVKAFTGKLPATGSQWVLVSHADLPLSADGSGDSACCLLSPALGEAPPIGPLRTDGLPRSLAPTRDPAARGGDDYHFIKQT